MSGPRGTVQRLEISAEHGTFKCYHRTRSQALFDQAEWGWSLDSAEAFIFESYIADPETATYENCATFHARALTAEGLAHVRPFVWTLAHHAEREKERLAQMTREQKSERKIVELPRVAPADTYAELEKRGLA